MYILVVTCCLASFEILTRTPHSLPLGEKNTHSLLLARQRCAESHGVPVDEKPGASGAHPAHREGVAGSRQVVINPYINNIYPYINNIYMRVK